MKNYWLSKVIKVGDVVEYTGYLVARQGTKMTVHNVSNDDIECIWFEGANLRHTVIKKKFLKLW